MTVFFSFVKLQRYFCYITTDIYLSEKYHLNYTEHDNMSLVCISKSSFFVSIYTIRPTFLSSSWFRPSNVDIFSLIFSSAEVSAAFSFSVSLKFSVFKYHLLAWNKFFYIYNLNLKNQIFCLLIYYTSKTKFQSHKIDDSTDNMPSIVSVGICTISKARRRLSNLSASLIPSRLKQPDWLR